MIPHLRVEQDLGPEDYFQFPDPRRAGNIVCRGANLSPGVLLSAYRQGIFPWFSAREPITWYSPDPRFVLPAGQLHISESARRLLNKARSPASGIRITLDQQFEKVIRSCATVKRRFQFGSTWITSSMIDAYCRLHELGYAHSVEVWRGSSLIGGLYGVSLGAAFFGESMFSMESGASKIGFLTFARQLFDRGYEFIDCQVPTEYLRLMGAVTVARDTYLQMLAHALLAPDAIGPWTHGMPEVRCTHAASLVREGDGMR